MKPTTQLQAQKNLIRDILRSVCTIKPAKVTKVSGNLINAKPLTKTKYKEGPQEYFPEVFDIPLLVYSGGGAFISVPIQVGDTVLLFFSDRDTGLLMETPVEPSTQPFDSNFVEPLRYYPLAAMPCFYTIPDQLPADGSKIVISNGSSVVSVSKDGDISISSGGNVDVEATGDVTVTAGGDAEVTATGNVDVTGSIINLNGG